MKCWKCGHILQENNGVCSVCGNKTEIPTTEVGKALRSLYELKGPKLFEKTDMMTAGLNDLLPSHKKTQNQIKLVFSTGIGRQYSEQLKKGKPDAEFAKRIRKIMIDDTGLSEGVVDDIAGWLDEMIGWGTINSFSGNNSFKENTTNKRIKNEFDLPDKSQSVFGRTNRLYVGKLIYEGKLTIAEACEKYKIDYQNALDFLTMHEGMCESTQNKGSQQTVILKKTSGTLNAEVLEICREDADQRKVCKEIEGEVCCLVFEDEVQDGSYYYCTIKSKYGVNQFRSYYFKVIVCESDLPDKYHTVYGKTNRLYVGRKIHEVNLTIADACEKYKIDYQNALDFLMIYRETQKKEDESDLPDKSQSVYGSKNRLYVGKKIHEGKLTIAEACEKYKIDNQTAKDFLLIYRASIDGNVTNNTHKKKL